MVDIRVSKLDRRMLRGITIVKIGNFFQICGIRKNLAWVDIFPPFFKKPSLFRNVDRNNDITGVVEHFFCVDYDVFGERRRHELKHGGKDIPVTEANKKEYISYVLYTRNYRTERRRILNLKSLQLFND